MSRPLQKTLYELERLLARGPLAQIATLIFLLCALAVSGGLVMTLFSPRFHGNVVQAVWWAFLHLTDTGYLGEDNDPLSRVVAISLTFSGVVFFLGGVVAILNNAFANFLGTLALGRTPVVESGHFLVIGAGPELQVLIEEIAHAAVQLWPHGRLPALVVLNQKGQEDLVLPDLVGRRMRLVVRRGDPQKIQSLERVDYLRSRAIIVLGHGPAKVSDLNVIKILMALRASEQQLPRIVLNLTHPSNRELAQSLTGQGQVASVPSLEFTGRLLCQTLRNPGLSAVYQQLLTDAYGQSVLLLSCDELGVCGLNLAQLMGRLKGAVPLGFVRGERKHIADFSTPLESGDELLIIAPSAQSLRLEDGPPMDWNALAAPLPPPSGVSEILVVGVNQSFRAMLAELDRYRTERYRLTVVCESPQSLASSEHLEIRQLGEVPAGDNFDFCVLLARDDLDPASADAETAMTYTMLRKMCGGRFLVDLRDSSNRDLLVGADVLVAPQIVSHMLAQVALKPVWLGLYEELFTFGGAELALRPYGQLAPSHGPGTLRWSELQRALLRQGYLALGLENPGLQLNPNAEDSVSVGPSTRVVVLEQSPGTAD